MCPCGQPLEVTLARDESVSRDSVLESIPSLWRYLSILPPITREFVTTLGEGWTPLDCFGTYRDTTLYFKDETRNPTGSFKDRGMSMAISMARVYGIGEVCLPSAGNAGVAAAAYCKEAGIGCHVYLPEAIPEPFIAETSAFGAIVRRAGRTMVDASDTMQEEKEQDWFDLSTLKEPFRVEGKKTLGYEIAEQLGWHFPDVVVYPTGGGTGLIGMWKAFKEMKQLGWVKGKLPRMVAVQSNGCAPVVRAFAEGFPHCVPWAESSTMALGLNSPNPLGGAWMLNVLRESTGMAVMVEEERIGSGLKEVSDLSGTNPSPEAAVAWLGFEKLVSTGWIQPGEKVVIPVTGSADRYLG